MAGRVLAGAPGQRCSRTRPTLDGAGRTDGRADHVRARLDLRDLSCLDLPRRDLPETRTTTCVAEEVVQRGHPDPYGRVGRSRAATTTTATD